MSGPSVSIYQLMQPVTQAQMRTTLVNLLVTLGVPANEWVAGGTFSTILTVISTVAASFSTLLANGIAAMFLDYATGSWLILLAYYVYGVTAKPATFASGQYTITNSGGGVYTYAAGTFQLLNSSTQQTYTNQAAFSIGALSSVTIDIECTQAGSLGNAAPAAVDTIVTVALGLSGTNAAAIVGQDAESDSALRARCQATLGLLSNAGPRNAYVAAVLGAVNASGNPVNINRVSVSLSSSTATVTVTVAAPSGSVTTEDLDAAALAVTNLVNTSGWVVFVVAATPLSYTNALTIYAQALPGVNATVLQAQAQADLTAWMAQYPIGGLPTTGGNFCFASGVNSVIGEVSQAIYAVTGATDLAMTSGQVVDNATSMNVVLVAP